MRITHGPEAILEDSMNLNGATLTCPKVIKNPIKLIFGHMAQKAALQDMGDFCAIKIVYF